MNNSIFVVAECFKEKLSDITFEMLGRAKELAMEFNAKLCAVILGKSVRHYAEQLGIADEVILLQNDLLAEFNPEAYRIALTELLKEKQPMCTFIGLTSSGIDIAAPLSAELNFPLVSYCKELRKEGMALIAVSQLYGGKMFLETEIPKKSAIISFLPGAFKKENGRAEKSVPIVDFPLQSDLQNLFTTFVQYIEPESGDVDITQIPVLVSIGRGIQNKENVSIAQELADILGGAVSASRPVVDQGWLPVTRQVGRSGMSVKPKLYLALGISGAPEHIEGIRNAEMTIAINTDANAPIFSVAQYGICGDILDLIPLLTERLKSKN